MKSFYRFLSDIELLSEMGISSGDNDYNSYSKDSDWTKFYKGTDIPKLLLKDIGSNHLRLYLVSKGHFYLTDENDNYNGQLELTINNKIGHIRSSNSKMDRGFYNIMFSSIFATGLLNEILSDRSLSSQAINSYGKLSVNSNLSIMIYNQNNNKYIPFSVDNYLKDISNVVSVKELHNIKEHFEDYYSRINSVEIFEANIPPSSYNNIINSGHRIEFLNYGSGLDNFLFCENFS